MDALLQSSKLLKQWPSILVGIIFALFIKWITRFWKRRALSVVNNKLHGEVKDVAGKKLIYVINK